jgi:hypothetical protein
MNESERESIWIGTEGLLSSGKVGKNVRLIINMHSVTCMKMDGTSH